MPDNSWGDGPSPNHEGNKRPDPRQIVSQGGPNGSSVGRAFKWSFFPTLGLALISLLGASTEGLYFAWFAGAIYAVIVLGIALIQGLVYVVTSGGVRFFEARNGAMISGMFAGVAVGAMVLALTCFVNLSGMFSS